MLHDLVAIENAETGTLLCTLRGRSPLGECLAIDHEGRWIASGGGDGTVTKTREYGRVSRMVSGETPDSRQRDAMTNRTRMSDLFGVKGRSSNLATTGGRAGGLAGGLTGVKATPRERLRFDEGVRMMSTIIGIEPQDVRVNMPVEAVFEEISPTISLPRFRPIEA